MIEQLIDRLTAYVEGETRELNDTDYMEVLEGVSCNLDASIDAKREELGG